MFRLNDRQLHILLWLIIFASLAIGGFFSWQHGDNGLIKGEFSTLSDLSEGWVAVYETTDQDKWKQYRKDDESLKGVITEVINLPNEFMTSDKVSLSQKIPDMQTDKLFLVFETKGQHIKVTAGKDELFENGENGDDYSYHVIEIPYQYRNSTLKIEIFNDSNAEKLAFGAIKIGTFNELIGEAFSENGQFILLGFVLIVTGIILLVINVFIKTDKEAKNKRLLLYGSLEGIASGMIFLFESRLVRILINWEFISYFILVCLIVITAILHLLVFRCLIKKKRILTVVDFGILFFCILFVSIMVLQWFSLLSFESIYLIEVVLFGVSVFVYTLLMGAASYDYKQIEGRPVFAANIILFISIILELVMSLTSKDRVVNGISLGTGAALYFVLLWYYGLKKAVAAKEKVEENVIDEQGVRDRAVEQFNPNLLFASFQTLQTLIKNDSKQSIKMIYYISVYVKNNLRAISNQGEIISFEEELEHIMSYLQLQKVRNNNLNFALECKVKNFKVPRNTIEPIVENAVSYGVAGKNNRGNVVVRSYEREDGYAIQVIDDGIGFDTSRLKKHSSTSLKNITELLESICKARCEIISKDGKGTVVTILLPVLDNDLLGQND